MDFRIPKGNISNVASGANGTTYFTVNTANSEFRFSTKSIPSAQLEQWALQPLEMSGSIVGRRYGKDQVLEITSLQIKDLSAPVAPASSARSTNS